MPPLSSQLKLKPNDALPVNTVSGKVSLAVGPGGRNPPPLPVHAVSSTARMPAAARTMDRRNTRGAPVFMVSPKLSGTRATGMVPKFTMSATSPGVQRLNVDTTARKPQTCGIYAAQMLKLRRTQEFGCRAAFGSSPMRQVVTRTDLTLGQAGDH